MKTKGLAYNVVLIMALCVLSAGGAWAVPSSDTIIGDNFTPIGSDTNTTTTGTADVFIGGAAGQSNISGSDNTFIGREAGLANRDGSSNTYLGRQAGMSNTSGKENTFIGFASGSANLDGSGNVFLGNLAGSSETNSNKLYIDNCFFTVPFAGCILPLIYGEFDNRIVALPDGKLGIGTITPQSQVYAVDLTGTNVQRGIITAQHSDTATAAVIQFKRSRGAESAPLALDSGDNGGAFHSLLFDGSNYLLTASIVFKVNGTVTSGSVPTDVVFFAGSNPSRPERMRLTSNGDLGIGTSSPTHPLEVCGAGGCSFNDGGTTWVNASSREFKENIQDLSAKDALDTLKDLNPVTFTYKTMPEQNHVGFIAEDVPDLVAMRDRKGLSAMDIVAVLTKVVQEQKQTIEAQQKSLKSFEVKLAKLESEVNRLKSKDMTAKAMNQD